MMDRELALIVHICVHRLLNIRLPYHVLTIVTIIENHDTCLLTFVDCNTRHHSHCAVAWHGISTCVKHLT